MALDVTQFNRMIQHYDIKTTISLEPLLTNYSLEAKKSGQQIHGEFCHVKCQKCQCIVGNLKLYCTVNWLQAEGSLLCSSRLRIFFLYNINYRFKRNHKTDLRRAVKGQLLPALYNWLPEDAGESRSSTLHTHVRWSLTGQLWNTPVSKDVQYI